MLLKHGGEVKFGFCAEWLVIRLGVLFEKELLLSRLKIATGGFHVSEIFCLSGFVEDEITTEYIKLSVDDVVYFKTVWIVNIHDADVAIIKFYCNTAAVLAYVDNGSIRLIGHLNILLKFIRK